LLLPDLTTYPRRTGGEDEEDEDGTVEEVAHLQKATIVSGFNGL
jgi:hypothetical protein